jgi:cytosine/adenosine deaminase-related metal-dependent hydrolase
LSIFEEIKTINKYCSFIPFNNLIEWACKNGAQALNYEHLGTIEVGKRPGIVEIPVTIENEKFVIHSGKENRII